MTHWENLNKLKILFPFIKGIDAAVLYGSYARNDAKVNSDVDIQIIINNEFEISAFIQQIKNNFHEDDVLTINYVSLRSKVVLYFKNMPKIEFALCSSINELKRNYFGSEVTSVNDTILFERCPETTTLKYILEDYANNTPEEVPEYKNVVGLINKFIYEFENSSNMHRRSDGYQFYFFYNIALHAAIQLHNLSRGISRFNFLPKYYLVNSLNEEERNDIYLMNGSLFLPEANQKKRKLLDFFYKSMEKLNPERLPEIKQICEWIYERDFFWNFRDVSTHNKLIKPGNLFRTATLSIFQQDYHFRDLIQNKGIRTIIDLRSDREIDKLPYNADSLLNINYVKCQLDPWNQPEWFKRDFNFGTNEEIAYRYFAIGCREQFKKAFETMLNNSIGASVIHCFAGKDRTGIFISLIHLLSGASLETIQTDYLASEVDVDIHRLNLVLEIIQNEGGIVSYLHNCGINQKQIELFKQKFFI